jgi:hypothetical protein
LGIVYLDGEWKAQYLYVPGIPSATGNGPHIAAHLFIGTHAGSLVPWAIGFSDPCNLEKAVTGTFASGSLKRLAAAHCRISRMTMKFILGLSFLVVAAVVSASPQRTIPRLADGKPDLQASGK